MNNEFEIDGSFAKLEQILPFLNDVLMIFFISLNILFIFITRFFLKYLPDNHNELFKFYKSFNVYFFIIFVLTSATDYLISQNSDFKFSDPMILATINTKFALYFFVLCNALYIYIKTKEAKVTFKNNNTEESKEILMMASQYFGSLNIAILIFIVYLKVVIGEFK